MRFYETGRHSKKKFQILDDDYILLIAPPERGHLNPMLELAKQLAFNQGDFSVKVYVSVPSYKDLNVSSWVTDEGLEYLDGGIAQDITMTDMHRFSLMNSQYLTSYISFITEMASLFHRFNRVAYGTLSNTLKKQNGRARLIIFDLTMLWSIDLAEELGSVPAIVFCPFLVDALNLVSMTPYWHTPSYILPYSPSNFQGRLKLFFYRTVVLPYQRKWIFSRIYQRHFDYEYLIGKHRLTVFVSTAPPFEIVRPVNNPAIHFLGPVNYQKRFQPIESSLLDWLDDVVAKNDTLIYVSLGSIGVLTDEQLEKLVTALTRLIDREDGRSSIRILWARGNTLKIKDERFRLEGYVPQKSILNHRAMQQDRSIYINHCGMGSMHEAIVFGIPHIAFPLFLDQHQVAQRSVQLGLSLHVDKDHFTPEELIEKILIIINNPQTYRRRIRQLADAFRIHGNGLLRAQRIIEHLIEYGRDHQLQTMFYESQMTSIEKYSYDIYLCLYLSVFFVFGIIGKFVIRTKKQKRE